MSTTTNPPSPAIEPATPINDHVAAAQALIAQIQAFREQVPNFAFPPSTATAKALVAAASVPQAFLEMMIGMIDSTPQLTGFGADAEKLRDMLSFAASYAALADETDNLTFGLRHTVINTRNQAGSTALTAFELARRLSKRPETSNLAPRVAEAQRALGRAATRRANANAKAKAKAAAAVTPSPAEATTAPAPATTTPAKPA